MTALALLAVLALAAPRTLASPFMIATGATASGIAGGHPQDPIASATTVPVERPPTPAPPVVDYTARFDLTSYEATLGGIAAAYPDLLRVRSLGKSRQGKEIWLAVVSDVAAGEPGRLPGVLVATSPRPSVVAGAGVGERGPEAAVFALAQLLESARQDTTLRELLRHAAVYFLPVLDPDAAFPAAAGGAAPPGPPAPGTAAASRSQTPEGAPEPRRARIDRDFPARWTAFAEGGAAGAGDPIDGGSGIGPYPLSEPESRLLARFLVDRTNLSAVVVMSDPPSKAAEASEPKPAGEKDPARTDPADRPCEPGSFEAFCLDVLDAAVVRPSPWTGAPRACSVGKAPEGFHAVAALVRDLAGDLPRLECAVSKVERLRPDLWIVELSVANQGRMACSGGCARMPGSSAVRLRTSGARVVGCALRRPGSQTFDSLRPAKSSWALGDLGGKENLGVRLVVQADEGTAVEAAFEGPRGGKARAEISLR